MTIREASRRTPRALCRACTGWPGEATGAAGTLSAKQRVALSVSLRAATSTRASAC